MIPPSPPHFALFGPALYGELYLGLCRALAAPWLDPGWLARTQARQQLPRAGTARPPASADSSEREDSGSAAAGQVIEVPAARWRAGRDRNGSSGASSCRAAARAGSQPCLPLSCPALRRGRAVASSAVAAPRSGSGRRLVGAVCGLCGALGAAVHWTDAAAQPETFTTRQAPPTRRQERYQRIALTNRILRHYNLQLGDFAGQSYVLRGATGRQEVVADLVGMWAAAERLAGRPCDPLDAGLLAALERA